MTATAELFDAKIRDKFKAEAPATGLQAKIAVISTQTEDDAKQAIQRIAGGEDFSAVAKSVSKEPDVQTTSGVKEYSTKEALDAAYRDYAFSAEVGSVSAPLASAPASANGATATSQSFYVVKLIDRSDQPLTDAQKTQVAATRLPDWLKTTQDEMQANGIFKQDWNLKSQTDALLAIGPAAGAKLAAQKLKEQQDQQRAQNARETTVARLTASPQVANTPSANTTPAPTSSDQGAGASPVAPGGNGQ